jgi:hypothetical protein
MKRLILLVFITSNIFAQSNEDILKLQKHYEAFEYNVLIKKANSLLLHNVSMPDEDLIKIHTLKAASYFAVKDESNTRKSFIDLLKINSNYELDYAIYSPKLVDFFNEVKQEFLDILETDEKVESTSGLEKSILSNQSLLISVNMNTAIAKSLFVPGLGHLQLNDNTKGWILTTISTVSLGSMIYSIVDANNKENDYLAEANKVLIQQKYDDYNKSYKIRNVLIASYVAIWLYSQIDILFFSNQMGSDYLSVGNSNNFAQQNYDNLVFSLQLPF